MNKELKKFKKLRKRILRKYSLIHDVPYTIANIVYMPLVFINAGKLYAKAMKTNIGGFTMIKNIIIVFITFLPVWVIVAFLGWLFMSPVKNKARLEDKEREEELVKFKNKELDKLIAKNKLDEEEKILFLYRDTAVSLNSKLSNLVDLNLEDN